MKYVLTFTLLFLCGFSLFKRADEKWMLPPSFIEQPFVFSEKTPEEIQNRLDAIRERHTGEAVEWWTLYKKALLLKTKQKDWFCEYMHLLSQEKDFPLQPNVQLNLYVHCHKEVALNLPDFPEWLRKKSAEEWYKKAKKQKNKKELMSASYSLYEFSEDKYLKERYLISAIDLAKNIGDRRLTDWQKELYVLAPRYLPQPSLDQKLAVAHDLRQARQFTKATHYYREILNRPHSSFKEKNSAFKWIRWVYKAQKNNARYLKATRQWKNWLKRNLKTNKKAGEIYHNIFYLLVRTQWTLNQTSKALSTLNQMEEELKGKYSLFTVYHVKALIFNEKKEWDKAILFFKKALNEPYPNISSFEKAQWNYGWVLKKAGQKEESLKILKQLYDTSESEYLPSRILFWMGKIYEEENKKSKAEKAYRQLIKKDPFSYYGLLAHYKLKKEIQIDRKKSFVEITDHRDYITAQWLISLNEQETALEFLKYHLKKYKKSVNKEEGIGLFYYMSQARFYFPLFQAVSSLALEEKTNFFRSYADLLFPVVYAEAVEKATQRFKLEKEMLYALIRQESAWNPKARSPADAFGLTQLRPFVAKRTARKYKIPYRNIRDLYIPKKNILLGGAFLRQLLNKYESQFIITVAVYNAGRTAVMNWMQNIPLTDPLFFIEEVPYEETRTYIRLLIRNFIFYKLITHPERKLLFPEELLNLKPLQKP